MKKMTPFLVLFVLLGIFEMFLVSEQKCNEEMETIANSDYLDFQMNRGDYILAEGTITEHIEPRSEHSWTDDPMKWQGGAEIWMCWIEYEMNDGKTVRSIFPEDPEKDQVGDTVSIAYRASAARKHISTRAEYIPNTLPIRRVRNQQVIAGIGMLLVAGCFFWKLKSN